jgi:hypothetical protein
VKDTELEPSLSYSLMSGGYKEYKNKHPFSDANVLTNENLHDIK